MLDSQIARVRDAAIQLRYSFMDLDEAKFGQAGVRLERKQKPRPGWQCPGNAGAVELDVELSGCLAELVRDLRNSIDPTRALKADAVELCSWLVFNAALVAEVDWVDDLVAELVGMSRRIDRFVHGGPVVDVSRPEPRQWAPALCQRLAGMGYRVTPGTLRKWVERSACSPVPISVELVDGKSRYLLTEVLRYVQWRDSKVK